jgi:hypothetical protein
MFAKEKEKHKEEKSYVVNRSFNTAQGAKQRRGVKMVDRRMRKDQRNEKFRAKKKGGKARSQSKSQPKVKKGGKR